MRKTKFFVAAMLFAAGAVSMTGCLENDEPLGIQELRSAKAELYRAQAALANAEIGLKEAQIRMKEAKIAQEEALTRTMELQNQMREIDLQLKQDSASAESARLQKLMQQYEWEMDSIQEASTAALLKLQQNNAIAQHNYELALKELDFLKGQTNDKYATRLTEVAGKLSTSMNTMAGYEKQIMQKQRELLIFNAQNSDEYVTSRLNKNIEDKAAELETAQEGLAKLETIYGTPATEWEAEGELLQAKIDSLQIYSDTLEMKIAKLENEKDPFNKQIAALEEQIDAIEVGEQVFELTIPREIQDDVYWKVLWDMYSNGSELREEFEKHWTYDGGFVLADGGEVLKIEGLSVDDCDSWYYYFWDAADELSITDNDYAQAQEQLKTLQGNMEHSEAVYNGMEPAWEAARDAYIKAKDDYLLNQQYSLRELTLVDVQAYYESERADADKEALVESLKDYYAKRAALDSTKVTYFDNATFELKEVDKELAVATLDDILEITLGGFDANWNNVSAYSGLLGNDVVIKRDGDGRDIVSNGSALVDATKGSMGAFYDLCYQLWGVNENGNVIIRYTTLKEEEVYDYISSVDESDVNDYGPVAYLMYENVREYDRFNNRFVNKVSYDEFYQLADAAYTAYLDKVVQEDEEMDAQKEALQAEKEALLAEIDAIDEKIDEVERLQTQAAEDQKLYTNILDVIAGYYGNALGETQVSYEEALEALKTQIAEKKEEIVTKEQNLAEANAMLEAWTQGLDVAENEELKLKAVKAYIAQVEEEIAGLQLKLDEEQKLFDQYTAEKDALMNVLIGKPYEE